jgi:hypothetical protein
MVETVISFEQFWGMRQRIMRKNLGLVGIRNQ